MISKTRITLAAIVLFFGMTVSCTDDQKQPEETVEPAATETPATPPPEEEAPAAAAVDVNEATQTVYFAFDDYTLDMSSQDSLSKLAEYMKANPSVVIQIEGHCDERGSIEYNLALGQRRAQSVKNYLAQLDIEDSRLTTISYGEEKPAVEGSNEEAWSKNRRAEFVISNP